LSRWFGLLEVIKGPFIDNKPIFIAENNPFVAELFSEFRFKAEILRSVHQPLADSVLAALQLFQPNYGELP
jgi:hypothetical protein